MTLYFAYGTNMDRAGMRQRCPGAHAVGTATLGGWRLMVMRVGYVSIAPHAGARVHGVLWRLTAPDLAALDAYESVETGLYRRQALPVLAAGRTQSVQVYVGGSDMPGQATPGHMPAVLAAARSWDLPAAYLDELQRLVDAG